MSIFILVLFIVLIAISIPIATSMGIVSVIPGLADSTFSANPVYLLRAIISGLESVPYLAIPMFILSGTIMSKGEISKKLFDFISYFIGKKRAGLPCAVIITCLFFGALSGSATATVAAVGSMTIPILVALNYDKTFCTALVAVAGGLGVIIPPSIPMIVYATVAGESVGDMFIGGILPGILIAVCLMVYTYYYCRKHGEDTEKISETVEKIRSKGLGKVFMQSFWALLTPVIILGSIYGGLATPTEAAVISVFYALVVSLFVYRTMSIRDILPVLKESVSYCLPALFILATASAFARVLALLQVPQSLGLWIGDTFGSKITVLLAINIFLLFLGMVMDTTPAIVIVAPILAPIVTALGVNGVHFGIIVVVNLAIGFVTPPIGTNLFIASSVTGVEVLEIAKKAVPFLLFFLVALMVVTFVPALSTCLL
ncbi:TRAP transporter large permease [Cuneatibacter sp. NSJ-177]|uniref:TRAP transporter large permease n=1 Tax=Cuneatibacter sp. NSJ-177 TaxID=2931401 RepID=UPI001FD1583D|nr:TRAP transporter large permease [Cuneatibacter sp. NSJ-177]MCJ7834439.1 TRAP transporter large permease [Cuneatibacter sp. NSJ-177]